MAAHERVAGVPDWLVGDAVDFGLRAPERADVLLVQLTQQVRVVAARSPARQAALVNECAAHWPSPLPSAPPLASRHTHGGCAWFTGNCSVPDRVTWFARATDRTASRSRRRQSRYDGAKSSVLTQGDLLGAEAALAIIAALAPRRGRHFTVAASVLRVHGPPSLGTRPC
jgi:hypothetical protein